MIHFLNQLSLPPAAEFRALTSVRKLGLLECRFYHHRTDYVVRVLPTYFTALQSLRIQGCIGVDLNTSEFRERFPTLRDFDHDGLH